MEGQLNMDDIPENLQPNQQIKLWLKDTKHPIEASFVEYLNLDGSDYIGVWLEEYKKIAWYNTENIEKIDVNLPY
jgi:hypothetical protein